MRLVAQCNVYRKPQVKRFYCLTAFWERYFVRPQCLSQLPHGISANCLAQAPVFVMIPKPDDQDDHIKTKNKKLKNVDSMPTLTQAAAHRLGFIRNGELTAEVRERALLCLLEVPKVLTSVKQLHTTRSPFSPRSPHKEYVNGGRTIMMRRDEVEKLMQCESLHIHREPNPCTVNRRNRVAAWSEG